MSAPLENSPLEEFRRKVIDLTILWGCTWDFAWNSAKQFYPDLWRAVEGQIVSTPSKADARSAKLEILAKQGISYKDAWAILRARNPELF